MSRWSPRPFSRRPRRWGSRTGRLDCWASIWVFRSRRWPGSGGNGICSRGGETFKFSTDPELDAKVRDVVGLYLNPPDKAVVVCIDEKSQIQALDRTAPILPIRPGLP